jgi:hypothetical protein
VNMHGRWVKLGGRAITGVQAPCSMGQHLGFHWLPHACRSIPLTHNLFSVDPSCPGDPAAARLVSEQSHESVVGYPVADCNTAWSINITPTIIIIRPSAVDLWLSIPAIPVWHVISLVCKGQAFDFCSGRPIASSLFPAGVFPAQ